MRKEVCAGGRFDIFLDSVLNRCTRMELLFNSSTNIFKFHSATALFNLPTRSETILSKAVGRRFSAYSAIVSSYTRNLSMDRLGAFRSVE